MEKKKKSIENVLSANSVPFAVTKISSPSILT